MSIRITPIKQVPLSQCAVTGGLWRKLMKRNKQKTLPHVHDNCKKTGVIDAWRKKPARGDRRGVAWDSDLAKYLEGVAYSLTEKPDPALEKSTDRIIEAIGKAQRKDGYLNTYFAGANARARWTNLRSAHEMYCAGHLMEAAVAYHEATGKRRFLDIMCRYADHIAETFGPGRGQKRGYPGHQEIELALVKLYRATGRKRYLDLVTFFINERGKQPFYFDKEARARGEDPRAFKHSAPEYSQAHLPVRKQKKAVGHAVRAMYLYSGMTDVAVETGDAGLMKACRVLWDNVTKQRMHITGAVGPNKLNEGFSADYDLATEGAYLETCGSVGLALWAHRMFLAEADGRHIDVMERCLYNAVLGCIGKDGQHFFYGNPLQIHPGFERRGTYVREGYNLSRFDWTQPPCCPTNMVRVIAQFPHFIYAQRDNTVFVNHYAASKTTVEVGGGNVRIDQKTEYPWDGRVSMRIAGDGNSTWTLALRIPGWCENAALRVGGRKLELASITRNGYAYVNRCWKKDDTLQLDLPMPVQRVRAHPKARQTAGRVALQRGPVVYCLEEVDNGSDLNDISLPADARLKATVDGKLFGGAPFITGTALRSKASGWDGKLYRSDDPGRRSAPIKAIPFHLWANRKPGGMLVWMREA